MRMPAPGALQLENELADFDFVDDIRQSTMTSGTSHLRLDIVRHCMNPSPLSAGLANGP
jgi:hypothetical protein